MNCINANMVLLRILGALAAIAVAVAGEAAVAQSTNAPPGAQPPQSEASSELPPALNRFTIRQDTPEQRAAFLKKREQSRVGPAPTEVAPFPQQAISPVAPQRP